MTVVMLVAVATAAAVTVFMVVAVVVTVRTVNVAVAPRRSAGRTGRTVCPVPKRSRKPASFMRETGLPDDKEPCRSKVPTMFSGSMEMARLTADVSNEFLETLADWSAVLEHWKSSDFPVPPCSL